MSDENAKVEVAAEAQEAHAEPKAEETPDAVEVKEEQAAEEEEAVEEGAEGEDAAGEGGEDAPASADKKRPAESTPTTLGFKLFNSGKDAAAYFKVLQHSTSLDTDMNEVRSRLGPISWNNFSCLSML